jgi:hypothetical protein
VANQLLHRGYFQSWNLVFERKLPNEFVSTLGYAGSASVRGFAFLDINAWQVPGSGNDGRPLYPEFGRTSTTRESDGRTHSSYHSSNFGKVLSTQSAYALGRSREFRLGLRMAF